MPVPKRKRSRARRDKRFANKGLKAQAFALCSNCDEVVQTHSVCQGCGFYRGRKVMSTKSERSVTRMEVRKEIHAKRAARMPQQAEGPIDAKAE